MDRDATRIHGREREQKLSAPLAHAVKAVWIAWAIADILTQAKGSKNAKLRWAATIVTPFTNIVANVTNESLNYTPRGVVRAAGPWASESLLGQDMGDLNMDQRADLRAELYAKAMMGTLMLGGLALAAASGLDDEDPWLAIFGAGPQDPADNKGWLASGGIKHSVKIGDRYYSYATTPLAIPLAILGGIMDRIRDAKVYGLRSAERISESWPLAFASALVGSGRVITEQSFLVGLMDIFDLVSNRDAEQAAKTGVKTALRTGSSFFVPNLVRQVDKFMDPTVYDSHGLEAALVQAVPFVRQKGRPAVNALGLPVENPLSAQFTSKVRREDDLVLLLAKRGVWPGLPSRNEIYPNAGRPMTDAEYYRYVSQSGRRIYNSLRQQMADKPEMPGLAKRSDAALTATVSEITSAQRQAVRESMGF